MPSVPSYQGGEPQLRPLQPANANPADFARPGNELTQLGQAANQVTNVATDVLVKEQDQKDLDSVFQAETTLKAQETEFHNSLRERRGRNADGASKEALKFWEESGRKAEGTLTTERQRRAFQRIVSDRRNASMDYVSRHEAQEMRTARLQAGEADIESTIQAGIANPGAVALNTTSIANTYRALAQAEGLDEDYVNLKIQSATTAMHTGVIAGMIDANPGGARLYYNSNKDAIKPSERAQIENQLRAGGLKEFSQRKATEISAKYGDDLEGALAYARANIQDADRQEATVAQIKTRFAESRTADTHRQQKLMDGITRGLVTTGQVGGVKIGTIHDLPTAYLDPNTGLNGGNLERVRAYLEARTDAALEPPKADNYQALDEAQSHIEAGNITDPQQLAYYQPFLTEASFKSLRTQVEKAKTVEPSVVLQEFENRQGAARSKWMDDPAVQDKWQAFQDFVYKRVREGARPADVRDLADEFFLQSYKPGSGVAGMFEATQPYGMAEVAGQSDYVVDVPEAQAPMVSAAMSLAEKAGVPTGDGQDEYKPNRYYVQQFRPAVQYLKRNNIPVGPDTIAAVQVLQMNKLKITPATIAEVLKSEEFDSGR